MKLSSSSKPISSPGRTEKFPPPLMRFLRSNVSSRSRGRSRASPLFMRKKKSITSARRQSTIETQEPSSPKVTCIGQVRVKRSKNNSSSSRNPQKSRKCVNSNHCYCLPKFNVCNFKIFRPKWPKWVLFFNCRSVRVRTESSKSGSARFEEAAKQHHDDDEEEETCGRGRRSSATTTPPKNALLLTRCRSAPYRSSSLAGRFWGEEEQKKEGGGEDIVIINRALEKGETMLLSSRDSTSVSRGDQEDNKSVGVCADGVVGEESGGVNEVKIVDEINCRNDTSLLPKPLTLMRCKSEPARRDLEKLNPQSSEYWILRRRLSNTENCTPRAVD